ncbi:MAG: beta-lactamase family protein [Acidobacteriia bacterium]|nr:beta-lactamase family protein [Terriglobia bacterium]
MELNSNFTAQDQRFGRALRLLRDAIAAGAFPGCSLAVVHGGELVACQGLGRFTYEPQSPEVTADTIFDVASLTKIVATTTMAMILYQRGLLDLDLPVESVVREFAGRDRDNDPRRPQVTIRSLLAHTSGLPAYVRLFEQARTRDELALAACRTPLEAGPGERTAYSDIGFIVLGEALARLADESLDSFCHREIFGPLGMSRTCFNPPTEMRPIIPPSEDDRRFRQRIMQGEVNDENAFVMGGVAGHAGLFSSAPDLARFAAAMLRGGVIVRAQTLAVFAQAHPAKSGSPRALGFDLPSVPSQSGRHFSPRALGHLGFTGTSLWLDRERDLAIALLSNRTWPDRSSQEIKRVRPLVHDAIVEALTS